jgi:hypothetical protein
MKTTMSAPTPRAMKPPISAHFLHGAHLATAPPRSSQPRPCASPSCCPLDAGRWPRPRMFHPAACCLAVVRVRVAGLALVTCAACRQHGLWLRLHLPPAPPPRLHQQRGDRVAALPRHGRPRRYSIRWRRGGAACWNSPRLTELVTR